MSGIPDSTRKALEAASRGCDEPLTAIVDAISEIRRILGLSAADIASLLNASELAVESWNSENVPSDSAASIYGLHRLAVLLYAEVNPESIPEIIHKSEPWLNNRSIFDVLKAEGVGPIYMYLNRLFEYRQ